MIKPTQKQRQAIFNRSNGLCWYCGCGLHEKHWHADHFQHIYRNFFGKGLDRYPEMDVISNLVPACVPCNLFKSTLSIEQLRKEIMLQVKRARKSSANFRVAERFGLIEVIDKPVIFCFEKNND